jgi:hypothetical protein
LKWRVKQIRRVITVTMAAACSLTIVLGARYLGRLEFRSIGEVSAGAPSPSIGYSLGVWSSKSGRRSFVSFSASCLCHLAMAP